MLLGIDIGGTTISLGLVDGKTIVSKVQVPSFPENASLDETLDYLSGEIAKVITPEVTRIGIGVPTLVDVERGIVYEAQNIPSWKEVHLKEDLEARFGRPVSVNNDANCYALGAAARLGMQDSSLVCITLGTGTGVGIVFDGKLYCGANCGAGEICSLPYLDSILEAYCSKQFFENRGFNARAASKAAEAGNPGAMALFDEFGHHMGVLLSMVMYAYDPACIVIGGGVANAHPLFLPAMERTLSEKYQYPHALGRLRIEFMPESDLPVLGASLL